MIQLSIDDVEIGATGVVVVVVVVIGMNRLNMDGLFGGSVNTEINGLRYRGTN